MGGRGGSNCCKACFAVKKYYEGRKIPQHKSNRGKKRQLSLQSRNKVPVPLTTRPALSDPRKQKPSSEREAPCAQTARRKDDPDSRPRCHIQHAKGSSSLCKPCPPGLQSGHPDYTAQSQALLDLSIDGIKSQVKLPQVGLIKGHSSTKLKYGCHSKYNPVDLRETPDPPNNLGGSGLLSRSRNALFLNKTVQRKK